MDLSVQTKLHNMPTRFQNYSAEDLSKSTKHFIKPSTELIPDEYDVSHDGEKCVHIFVADDDLEEEYTIFLKNLNIEVTDSYIHEMKSEEDILSIITEVANSPSDCSLLLMLFWGYSKTDGTYILENDSTLSFCQIWSSFLANFREKPKIFIFNVIQSIKTNEHDGVLYKELINPYQVPIEADLLIIYKHNKDKKESIYFIMELADTFDSYGKTEDFNSVVTLIDTDKCTRPVIISTLLKKLYMIPSHLRGNYLDIDTNNACILAKMNEIVSILSDVKKEKEKPSYMQQFAKKISLSFRNKKSVSDSMKEECPKCTEENSPSVSAITATRKRSKDLPRQPLERTASRPSVDTSSRRSSIVKSPVRKKSVDERKLSEKQPWRP